MTYSRRDLSLLFPALAAAGAGAQTPALQAKTYRFEDLPVKTSGTTHTRPVLDGKTYKGFPVEVHETELAAGAAPPLHHHVHEEVIMVHAGTIEVNIAGARSTLGPGSVIFVSSDVEHGWRNVGKVPAQYFVCTLGRER